jgi:putative salt-induced outer membrane protein
MPWEVKAKAAFAQTETEGVLSTRSLVAGMRADRFLSPRTSLFTEYDYLRDLFAGIEQRHTVAGGIAYRLVDHAPHQLTIDAGLGYEHEARVDEESENRAIFTPGLTYRWKLSETSESVEELRYLQAFEDLDDWKLDQAVAITAAINTQFSLKLANTVRYVNLPPLGFESTDTITSVALVWTVKRPGP